MADDKPSNAIALYGAHKRGDGPLPVDTPSMGADPEAVTIDLSAFDSRIEPPAPEKASPGEAKESSAPPAQSKSAAWWTFAPLAASLVIAALIGAFAGAGATVGSSHDAPATAAALSNENRALQERVARLSSELTAVKSGMDAATRATVSQLGKINERLDRAEKAQSEPAARLAKIAESIERLERRVSAPLPPPDVTGSVTAVEKNSNKPVVVEGWKLVDYYAGRAVLESRNGALYEVAPGSNLPGVGRVDTIKRVDGKIVVSTQKGIIASAVEMPAPRRPQFFRY